MAEIKLNIIGLATATANDNGNTVQITTLTYNPTYTTTENGEETTANTSLANGYNITLSSIEDDASLSEDATGFSSLNDGSFYVRPEAFGTTVRLFKDEAQTIDIDSSGFFTHKANTGVLTFTPPDTTAEEEEEEETKPAWQSLTLGDHGGLAVLFEKTADAVAVNKAALTAFKTTYETSKALKIAAVNPVFALLETIISQVDTILADLEKLGFFMLNVNSYTVPPSTTKAATYGSFVHQGVKEVPAYYDTNRELVGAINGRTVKDNPPLGQTATDKTWLVGSVEAPQATDPFGLKLTKLVPYSGPDDSGTVTNELTGMLELNPSAVISKMAEAFNDEGDQQKEYQDAEGFPVSSANEAQDIILYDKNGEAISHDKRYVWRDHKPNFGSDSAVGGICIIYGATTITGFLELIYLLKDFFKIPDLEDLFNDLAALLKPPAIKVQVNMVHDLAFGDDTYGSMAGDQLMGVDLKRSEQSFGKKLDGLKEGEKIIVVELTDVDGEETGFKAQVISSSDSKKSEIYAATDKGETKKNINTLPYWEETLTLQPFQLNKKPQPGNILTIATVKSDVEAEAVETDTGSDEDLKTQSSGAKLVGEDGEQIDAEIEYEAQRITHDVPTTVCLIKTQVDKPDSVPPDFMTYTLTDLIPILGTFIRWTRGELNSFRGLISTAQAGINRTIKTIDERVEQIVKLNELIISIQEQFINLQKIGLYVLVIPPETGGTAAFLSTLQGADNQPPASLRFSAGSLIMGGSPDSKSTQAVAASLETLQLLLGIKDEEGGEGRNR